MLKMDAALFESIPPKNKINDAQCSLSQVLGVLAWKRSVDCF